MKRIIALLLAVIMVLSLVACGNVEPETTEPTTTETPNEPTATPDEPTATPDEPTATPDEPAPFVPELGDGVYGKISYTVTDQEVADNRTQVVATVADRELTLGVLQVYYWMSVYGFLNEYGAYAPYFGLDPSKPLDQQQCPQGEGTWQQYFLDSAVDTWHTYQCLVLQGEAENSPMNPELQEELDNLPTSLADSAKQNGYESVEQMLQGDIAPGITYEDYYAYLSVYSTGYSHYMHRCDTMEITDDMIEAYFTEHEEELAESELTKDSGKVVDVRHILVTPKGGTTDDNGATTYSDDEWTDCEKMAQDLLDRWLNGEKTEEFFAELAELYTDDPGSKQTGGLYENVKTGDMVEAFDAWCFDDARKVGDYGLVKTNYGYHVMFYSGDEALWIFECRKAVMDQKINEFVEAAVEAHELKADYEKMMIGSVDLAG